MPANAKTKPAARMPPAVTMPLRDWIETDDDEINSVPNCTQNAARLYDALFAGPDDSITQTIEVPPQIALPPIG